MRICLVSRELYPFAGGGIAPIVAAAARALSANAEVTVVTSADHETEYRQLRASGDPRVLPDSIRVLFVEEPGKSFGGALHYMHAYSARVHDVLWNYYDGNGPDIIEFCDYLAEGFVTIQARHTEAQWLAQTLVCVRLHTTSHICSVLDGFVDQSFEVEALFEAERYCLHNADYLLWSGGDIIRSYQRIYGNDRLAPAIEIPDAFLDETHHVPKRDGGPLEGSPVQILYLGRLERRKGIHDLVRALLDTGRDDWRLTLVGNDTDTGPLGTSMEEQLRLTAAEDPRVTFHDPVPRAEVGRLIDEHHVVAIPSRWECWPNVGREALQHNRPIFATPVGGLTAMVRRGISGWLSDGTGRQALRDAVIALLDDPGEIVELISSGGPRRVFDELTATANFRDAYVALLERKRPHCEFPVGDRPLVSVIVPYYRLPDLVERTLDSIAHQTYGNTETIVVNDGSFRPEDQEVLVRVARRPGTVVVTQTNAGLGAARNFGISQAHGDLILPLDADDLILPGFIQRLVDVLQRRPELAYAGTWVQYMDEDEADFGGDIDGYMPYGNWSTLMRRNNVAGVCSCIIRRSVFDSGFAYDDEMTSYEDWLLFREMQEAHLLGAIVPERLFRYRIRAQSMTRQIAAPTRERLAGDLEARLLERTWRWTASDPVPPRGRSAGTKPKRHEVTFDPLVELRAANAQLAAVAGGLRGAAAASALRNPEAP